MPVPSPGSREKFDGKSESKLGQVSMMTIKEAAAFKVDEDEIMDQVKESNVGKELISNITKIVIIVILMIMFSVALFSSDTYLSDDYDSQRSALKQMER